MTNCRKCGWYYKNIKDWLYHQYDHKNGTTRKPWGKRTNSVQKTPSRNDRKRNG